MTKWQTKNRQRHGVPFYSIFQQAWEAKAEFTHRWNGCASTAVNTKEEEHLISCMGTVGEKEAKSRLIEHNLRLVVYIAKKF